MFKKLLIASLAILSFAPESLVHAMPDAHAISSIQDDGTRTRRKRPGQMKHTEAEVQNVKKITKVNARYIHDGVTMNGGVYMTGDAGAIKVGDAVMQFRSGKYYFGFESAEFDMRDASTRDERRKKGISEYEYNHSWKKEKIGGDFQHSGKYEVVEQYGKIHLILYNGDTSEEFAKILLTSATDSSFDFYEDDFLIRMAAN